MNIPPVKASRGQFRCRRYGVYDLTYEDVASPPFTSRTYSLLDGFRAICKEIPHVRRQLVDTTRLAPAEFVAYMVTTVWLGIYSAINLYWLSVLFDRVCRSRHHTSNVALIPSSSGMVSWTKRCPQGRTGHSLLPGFLALWSTLLLNAHSKYFGRTICAVVDPKRSGRSLEILTKRFRAHFLPQLIRGRAIHSVIVSL